MNHRRIKLVILLFIGLIVLASILSPLAAGQEDVEDTGAGWKLIVPPKADQWWKGLSVIERMGRNILIEANSTKLGRFCC